MCIYIFSHLDSSKGSLPQSLEPFHMLQCNQFLKTYRVFTMNEALKIPLHHADLTEHHKSFITGAISGGYII